VSAHLSINQANLRAPFLSERAPFYQSGKLEHALLKRARPFLSFKQWVKNLEWMEEWPNWDQLVEPERDSSPIWVFPCPPFPIHFPAKSLGHVHSSSALLILGSKTPLLLGFALPWKRLLSYLSFSLPTFPCTLSCKKPRTRAQQQHPLDPLIKDPVAVGVHPERDSSPIWVFPCPPFLEERNWTWTDTLQWRLFLACL
jgi:hypothetical protein